ncbi:hypothetical protein AAFP30_15620 [Gordonia sp. CPCC 205515]|uniref:hypothetical protein n=1 Tax=Gordonia sp. CPCC 205515 TaxID=3140791 RepID=UPI003AF3D463
MRPTLMDRFTTLTGAMNRAELLAGGYADHEIRAAVRAGVLSVLAPGVLIRPELLDGTPEQRHGELAVAWARRSAKPGRPLALVSAAAVHGLPVWGLNTSRVVLTDADLGPGSRSTGVVRLLSDSRPPAVTVVRGVLVQSPARVVVEFNGLAESVLESRSRIMILDAELPAPELQVEFFDRWGRLIARVDFYWRRHRVVGECNGLKKYKGDDGVGRVLYEKDRSDKLIEHGEWPINWGWKDLDQPKKLVARLKTRLAISGTDTTPVAEHK